MSEGTVPQRVIRFYGCTKYATDVIQNKEIAFVSMRLLNDPFDPYCFFETDFEDKYDNLLAAVERAHPDLSLFQHKVTKESWEKSIYEIKSYFAKVRETGFVFSTSALEQVTILLTFICGVTMQMGIVALLLNLRQTR